MMRKKSESTIRVGLAEFLRPLSQTSVNVNAANVVTRTVVADTKTAPICPTLKPPTAIDDDKDELSTDKSSIFFVFFLRRF